MDWGADPGAGRDRGAGGDGDGLPPDRLVDAVESAIGALQASEPKELSTAASAARVVRIEALLARLTAHEVACVEVMDRRGDAMLLRARSVQAWLRRVAHLAPGAAKGMVKLARQLPACPATKDAFASGRVGLRHAQVLARTLEELIPHLADAAEVGQLEKSLVQVAVVTDPLRLSEACRRLRIQAAPQRAVADDWSAVTARYLNISRTLGGMGAGEFLLDPVTAESVLAAIHSLSAPAGAADDRSPGQRRADALGEICRRVLAVTDLPATGGERPQALVTVPLTVLEERARRDGFKALDALADPATADLSWAGPVSGELARRLCCDAMITRVVTAGASLPLDVGRATRVVPAGIRRALLVRDRHCQYPGCDMPGVWCDAHHRRHWARGGETKLSNLVLLCGYHHTRLHLAGEWLERHPDGTIEIIPDPDPDHHDHDREDSS